MKAQTIRAFIITLSLLLGLGSGQALAVGEPRPGGLQAALGPAFTYQGYLTDAGGTPIDSTCDLRFSLWDSLSSGSQVEGNSEALNVGVDGGYFTAAVNSLGEFGGSAFNGQARWLQIAVRCPAGGGAYTDLTPRQALSAAPYASYAPSAGSAPWSGLTGVPAGFADGVDNNDTYTNGAGLNLSGGQFSVIFAGDGSASSAARSDHSHASTYAPLSHNHWGANWSGGGVGLTLSGGTVGLSGSGSEAGVRGQSASSTGYGLYGENTYTSGSNYGVYGKTYSDSGYGVYGEGPRYGVFGLGTAASGANGLYGISYSTSNARGVLGVATATTGDGVGVEGSSSAPEGIGVWGRATASSGTTYGVYGYSSSASGAGVYGRNNAAISGIDFPSGVHGKSDYGIGVLGESTDSVAVYAAGFWGLIADGDYTGVEADGSYTGVKGYAMSIEGANFGVLGQTNSGEGYAGYFSNENGGVALLARSDTPNDIFRVERFSLSSSNTVFRVNGLGNVQADGGYHCGNDINDAAGDLDESEIGICLYDSSPADFAEMLPASQALEPGEVLVIGQDGELARSNEAYQAAVVGVYSTRPSYLGNSQKLGQEGYVPLAIAGLAPVKVSAENGPIQPGDLLVSASIPGHAMRCQGVENCFGRTIGKAMQPLPSGAGVILVLIILQ
ncbi:MAG: hypothetical protein JXA78_11070 [Anaerolineales bacterium]|nr:hypothetical protein [Anaerolineales bacterium]